MPTNDTSIFNIGRVPKYLGNFEENHNYRIYNIVSYVDSCFISVFDNNANVPVSLTRDSSGYLESYTLNTGWDFLMNGLDSSIEMSKAIKECINTKNQIISALDGKEDKANVIEFEDGDDNYAEDNSIYVGVGEISDWMLMGDVSDKTFAISFDTASSGTITISLPIGIKFTETPTFGNSEHWEIAVRNGYAVFTKYDLV